MESDKASKSARITGSGLCGKTRTGDIEILYNVVHYGTDGALAAETTEISLGHEGSVTNEKHLNANGPITWTSDGGYVFAAFPVPKKMNILNGVSEICLCT